MTMHSPGPWEVVESPQDGPDSDVSKYEIRESESQFVLATVIAYHVSEHTSNAHLISAAPQMLEALKDVEWSDCGQCPQCGMRRAH